MIKSTVLSVWTLLRTFLLILSHLSLQSVQELSISIQMIMTQIETIFWVIRYSVASAFYVRHLHSNLNDATHHILSVCCHIFYEELSHHFCLCTDIDIIITHCHNMLLMNRSEIMWSASSLNRLNKLMLITLSADVMKYSHRLHHFKHSHHEEEWQWQIIWQ